MNVDFSKDDFMQTYKNYDEFYQCYADEKHELFLDYIAFKSHWLFVIDCSRREENMKYSTVDIKL